MAYCIAKRCGSCPADRRFWVMQGSADVLAARDTITAWSNAAMQACLLHKDCQAEAQLLRPVLDAIGGCLDAIVVCM